MTKNTKYIILILISLTYLLTSCMDDNMRPITAFDVSGNGVFISCEGNFMYGNASLSYYDRNTHEVRNQIFLKANSVPLGDVSQSLLLQNNTLWISVNNSGKLYAIDPSTFLYKGKVNELISPRYMLPISDDEMWVSDLYAGKIHIINPSTFEVTGSISLNNDNTTTHNAERMTRYNDIVICNSWSYDHYLFFIDTKSKTVVDSLEVKWQPKKICLDKFNKLWVLSDGGYEGSPFGNEPAALQRIDPDNGNILCNFELDLNDTPTDICLNSTGDSIYLINNDIFVFSVESNTIGEAFIKNSDHRFFSIGYDPKTSDIYLSDVCNYMDTGTIYRYSQEGILIDSFETGVNPSEFLFE